MFTQFLLAVQTETLEVALSLSEKILDYEPDNKLIREYQKALLEKQRLRDEQSDDDESSESDGESDHDTDL